MHQIDFPMQILVMGLIRFSSCIGKSRSSTSIFKSGHFLVMHANYIISHNYMFLEFSIIAHLVNHACMYNNCLRSITMCSTKPEGLDLEDKLIVTLQNILHRATKVLRLAKWW